MMVVRAHAASGSPVPPFATGAAVVAVVVLAGLMLPLAPTDASNYPPVPPCAFGTASADFDCGFNGVCQETGVCRCDKPWQGVQCSTLDLAPASRAGGYKVSRTTSWGGSVLRDANGTYWMWAAEMVDHCGLGAWTRNSRVVINSSPNATGPFAYRQELAGVFSHEPAAARTPTGEFVVWFTSSAYGCNRTAFKQTSTSCVAPRFCSPTNASDCPNPGGRVCATGCVDGSTTPACKDNKGIEHAGDTLFPTWMTWAAHPLGPWSDPVMVYDGIAETSDPPRASGDTNFAGVINDDGSVVGLWRGGGAGKECNNSISGSHCSGGYQYLARARHWKDAASYQFGAPTRDRNILPSLAAHGEMANCGIEDPTVWKDRHGRLHALVHNWAAGGHAASGDDGKTWRWFGGACNASGAGREGCRAYPASQGCLDWGRSAWPPTVTFVDGR